MFLKNLWNHKRTLTALVIGFLAISPTVSISANTWRLDANNKWHFYDRAGTELKDLRVRINNKWYYFNSDGVMVQGWYLERSGNWFYFDASGAALMGWHKIDGKDYYFQAEQEGSLLTNGVTPDGYVVDKYGAWTGERASYAPKSTSPEDFNNEILRLVNNYRAEQGLSQLTMNQKLQQLSEVRAKELATSFSHDRPSGNIEDLYDQFGYDWGYRAENIAAGQTTPETVMTSWMHSEGHRMNILSKDATEIGIAHYTDGHRLYWVQSFATARR